MKESISVVIPYFNDSAKIKRCIESILHQSLLPSEIVIVDDASADSKKLEDTLKALQLEIKEAEIKVIYRRNTENMNGAYSRNLGVKLSNSIYIAFLDSDDYWLEKHLELSFNGLVEANADFVYSNIVYEGASKGRKIITVEEIDYKSQFPADILFGKPPQTNSFFFQKKISNEISFDESLKRHQDYQFIFDLALSDLSVKYLNFSTSVYCDEGGSNSRFHMTSMYNFWNQRRLHFSEKKLKQKAVSLMVTARIAGSLSIEDDINKYEFLHFLGGNICYIFAIKLMARPHLRRVISYALQFTIDYRSFFIKAYKKFKSTKSA
ncbi:glycosyltransferase family 2 protein [Shewanella sp. 3_MG-2023]|uniref:glycosyltransferase family 2 protein n=1 Tax=Shewanella sp. 3_MG-2023 TaxID=3062635 RepID=UPI0026E18CE6|nr:glycosyltransferase family 2 protein [Shewanella sp. 3_MG-2023]MDO6776595.1 glycosyltransferase family 2 protein [Shewanella sp. 3_MG-2023]